VETAADILLSIHAAWDAHAAECPQLPKAILLNPANYELVGWDEVLGLPVLPDERVSPMRFKLVCGTGRGGYCSEGVVYWDDRGGAYVAAPALAES
jgi:hypothetical protein